jgi:repressor LexA
MKDAGLLPGDTVVVKRGSLAQVGDIVVVTANGDGTVKELAQHANGELYLKARNPAYSDITPADDSEIVGIVVGQFRRYERTKLLAASAPKTVTLLNSRAPKTDLNTGSISQNRRASIDTIPVIQKTKERIARLKVALPLKELS